MYDMQWALVLVFRWQWALVSVVALSLNRDVCGWFGRGVGSKVGWF